MKRPPLHRIVLTVLLLAAGLLSAASTQPALATTSYVSTSHPFSNPVWYPLNVAASMGCDMGNPSYGPGPTCRDPLQHTVWSIDLVSATRTVADPHQPVFPMGAGILHYGATNQGCGTTSSRGNWVYIDHGDGIISIYGHLGTITVANGSYVSVRTQIATIGNSGYINCKTVNNMRYLYLAVKHGGTSGYYYDIQHMYVCQHGVEHTWPADLSNNPSGSGHWNVWNDVPSRMPLQAPDSSRGCIPAPPATPNAPSGARLYRTSTGVATAYWYHPYTWWHVTRAVVQFQEWHPSISMWLDQENLVVINAVSARFSGLESGRLYRMRVSFANGVGWSAPTAWHEITSL